MVELYTEYKQRENRHRKNTKRKHTRKTHREKTYPEKKHREKTFRQEEKEREKGKPKNQKSEALYNREGLSQGNEKNLGFTTVLSVRSARSGERVVRSKGAILAPRSEKDIFY